MKTKSKSRLNVKDDLISALSCIELQVSLLSNRLSLRLIVAHVVLLNIFFHCFYFCSKHVQQLSYWRSCIVGGQWTVCLFIN